MTSAFARNGQLSPLTLEAYVRYSRDTGTLNERLGFYFLYLSDIAPSTLTVEHVPTKEELRDRNPPREELQLRTSPRIVFISGLVSAERHYEPLERAAGDGAYTAWLYGDYVADRDKWRFFTGQLRIKSFNSRGSDEWEIVGGCDPTYHAEEVAQFLREAYDKLPYPFNGKT